MSTNQLSERARAFLAEPRFGVLATINADGSPQLTTMWYELQGDEIMMNTLAGRLKDRNLRRNARVALCFEEGYQYVTVTGTVRLVEDQATARADIAHLAHRYHPAERAAQMVESQFSRQERVTLRMTIERVSEHW
ncbi:pyridoxamine 5'-phosphate oxidase [Kouleothrix aurantiaca]|uniref:Pyridoxamine 5'-phosphate oxidase n=1 Tax=Kouleothrix aurantiaca TaxID=186479 RepID=A0A0P9F5J7_9CHLR|nr:pyridoxamine 5'-phosphate oxidase [Kouleothrix aurantiaca]